MAIKITLKKRNEEPTTNLTPQDVFYVRVTKVHELFKALASMCDEMVQQEQSTVKVSRNLQDISAIFLVICKL